MDCCNHVEQELNGAGPHDAATGTYTCPMHPEIRRERPGMCPECGMALVKSKTPNPKSRKSGEVGQPKHAGHSTAMFLRKFWVSLALSVPVVLYSDIAREVLGLKMPDFPGSRYLVFLLASAVFFYGGAVFLQGAWREIRGRLPGMMTLIALAVSAAYLWSAYAVFAGAGETLFWELSTLITIMLLGHWLEMKAVQGAQGALKELSKLLPDMAEVVRGGETAVVPLSELREGDVVVVRPGGKVPADGVVLDGRSDVNEAMVTGESRPVLKTAGGTVVAGTISGDGVLHIRVTGIGEHTFLAGIMRLVEEAQSSKSRLQILADRAALYLTGVAALVGGVAFFGWLAAGAGLAVSVERLVAVLVIACPHALGLAVPLVASISTTLSARRGFLVRERLALEAARNVDVVLFDKTGTLTTGEYGVEKIYISNSKLHTTEEEVLRLAMAVDTHSEHFIARAIMAETKRMGLVIEAATGFERLAGKGVRGKVGGRDVFVGGEAILAEAGAALPDELREATAPAAKAGKTVVYVCAGGAALGAITLGDVVRRESKEAVLVLQRMGVRVAMITGDSEAVAAWVAGELGITEYFARVLPGEKAAIVRRLQEGGASPTSSGGVGSRRRSVGMVGDGINDAPALSQSDVGIAIGAGTNVAVESAGIVLVRNDPRDIPEIIALSRATYRKMTQNLFWAAGYNVVAMPLAAGALAPWGITLQPAVAALLMSFSTVIVAFNALLLRQYKGRISI